MKAKFRSREITFGEKERVQEVETDDEGRPIIEVEPDVENLYSKLCEIQASDGLPVIPPTKERVGRMLEHSTMDATEIIMKVPPYFYELTVEKLAINAVMAGCKPEYFPVIIAAFEAMKEDKFNLQGIITTTAVPWPAIIVSGPYAQKIGMGSGYGCLGPGYRANATIGRALTLTLITFAGCYPGFGTHSTQAWPGRYTLCFAEELEDNPWKSFNAEKGFENDTTVTVVAAKGSLSICHLRDDALGWLKVICEALAIPGTQTAYVPGVNCLVVSPVVAKRFVSDGNWTKEEIKKFVYENARLPAKLLLDHGWASARYRAWPKGSNAYDAMVPFLRSPDDLIMVVAGSPTQNYSTVVYTWGGWSEAVTKPVDISGRK